MPSGSTRLTVTFLYSFPLIVLKSSASAIDADNPVKITSVACQCFTAADSASFALHTATTKNNVLSAVNRRFEFQKRSQLFIPREQRNAFRHRDARQQRKVGVALG